MFYILGSKPGCCRSCCLPSTSQLLKSGDSEWTSGPKLPKVGHLTCAFPLSQTSFIVVYGRDVHEFDSSIAGPASALGWRPEDTWPRLLVERWQFRFRHSTGCAVIGDKAVIAGGRTPSNDANIATVEILDLKTKTVIRGQDMLQARTQFPLVTVGAGDNQRLLALGGWGLDVAVGTHQSLSNVEEWNPETGVWSLHTEILQQGREDREGVAVLPEQVCSSVTNTGASYGQIILMVRGYGGDYISTTTVGPGRRRRAQNPELTTTELYPPSSACVAPVLPTSLLHSHPITFSTESGLVATCGNGMRCLVLSTENRKFEANINIPDIPDPRYQSTSVLVQGTGVFILGGWITSNSGMEIARTFSILLRSGGSTWEDGPTLPQGGAVDACSVPLGTSSSFLLIGGKEIRETEHKELKQVLEYNIQEGWAPIDTWPQLLQGRQAHGCAIWGQTVIVAGGFDQDDLSSTEIIDIRKKTVTAGGPLNVARSYFAMTKANLELYILGGRYHATVERWNQANNTWTLMEETLSVERGYTSAVAIQESAVCQTF